ncbi:MAG: hypothetical protein ACFFB5_15750 [Promethearchaeota archaeon]
MKEIRNGTTLLLLVVLIFAFSVHGLAYFIQFYSLNTQYSSTSIEGVKPLRKNIPSSTDIPRTGIIPPSEAPRGSINEIVDGPDQYFPESSIRIRNRFTIPATELAIVQQVIYILLFEASVEVQTMINEGNNSDPNPTSSSYYVHQATTNGTPAGTASYSTDPSHGWIDTTFIIPNMTSLEAMGISSGDDVDIFQCYPAKNATSRIGTFLYYIDTFKLSAVADFTSDGFINDASSEYIFRSGENATAILRAQSGTYLIDNVTVTINNLYNKSHIPEVEINPATYDIHADLLAPDNKTDTNGEIRLFVDTTYLTTPEGEYSFNITADFTETNFYAAGYEKIVSIRANFTVENTPDRVIESLVEISAEPAEINPPNANKTIVTVKIQAQFAYGGIWSIYPLSNLPINAALDIQEVWVNLTSGFGAITNGTPGWYLTDSNGEVKFNITAGFPIPYQSKTPNIIVQADLQSNAPPTYPPSEPHRFLENDTGGKIFKKSQMITIDPDFWIGTIDCQWSNTTSVRPGETAELHYEVRKDGDSPGTNTFAGVPVNITLDEPIPGVSLDLMTLNNPVGNGYYYTDSEGMIKLIVKTTYLLTPEIVQTVKLNLTVDFENDSNVRWIGDQHKGYGSFEDFDKTWLSELSEYLSIDPKFNICSITLSTTNESGDTTIRRGDDLIITYKVRDEDGVALANVYVNASIDNPRPGVSLAIHPDHAADKDPLRLYYNTSSSGEIKFILSTDSTIPKLTDIKLRATADFENDSHNKWYVGSKGIRSDFRSNSSYSVSTRTIRVDPQYFIGYIYVPKDNLPDNLVQQNETLEIEFRLQLREYPDGDWITPPAILIDGVNISILINGQYPADLNMEVTPARSQYSDNSSVTFYILTNATGLTPEGDYTIEARAEFGDAQGLIYNFTHDTVPSGHLSGIWVNGSIADTYSTTSHTFEVKNIDKIEVTIPTDGVTDPYHTDVGFNSDTGVFEVYRGTTNITVEGTYKDSTQDPVQYETIEIRVNYTSNGERVFLTNAVTDALGSFSVVVNLPPNTPLKDNIMIYGEDPTPPTPREGRQGYDLIRVVTTINLNDYTLSNFNGSSVFVGSNVTVSGTLTDNLGLPIDSSSPIFSDSYSELNDRIRVVGWNGTHEIGMNLNASPNVDGTYSLYYIIPHDYNVDRLYIRLNITSPGLVHYRVNHTEELIYVYWDFQIGYFQIYFPFNFTTTNLTSGGNYVVTGINNRDITIRGTLQSSTERSLNGKWINPMWDGSSDLQSVDPAGDFSLDYSFTGWENDTWVWQLYHFLDNGTILSKYYEITLQWKVYDETKPIIDITSPITSNGIALLPQNDVTQITASIIDPGPTSGFVSGGLDNLSVTIWINGISDAMDQDPINGYIFTYDWDTSKDIEDITYNITVSAFDLANNWNKSEIKIIIDIVEPMVTIEVPENNDGYIIVDLDTGYVSISGTIKDNQSETGWNTGVNSSSVRLFIINPVLNDIKINTSMSISDNNFEYEWEILIDKDNLLRNDSFANAQNWKIRLTYSDLAGNDNYTDREVKLDYTPPKLDIVDELPDVVDENLVINITFSDQETGIFLDKLTLELLNSTGATLDTIKYEDANITKETNTEATIVLDISDLDEGKYSIKITIFDRTGNKKTVTSEPFSISRPGAQNPLGTLFLIVLSPILAFGGGIGLAALYERFKGIRGA